MALCPICQQELPEGPLTRCPSCGAEVVAAAETEWSGAPAGPPPLVGGTPWDERARLGVVAALVETTRQVMTKPKEFFGNMPVAGGIGSAMLYGVIVGWVGSVAAALYQALFRSIVGVSPIEAVLRSVTGPAGMPAPSELSGFMQGWGGLLGQVVFGGVLVAIGIIVSAGLCHLGLLVLGGASQGFEATLRVASYAQAVAVLSLVPFCGQLVGAIWILALYVIGLAEAQRIGVGKALAAVLLPIVVLCCCCGVLFFVLFAGIAGLASQLR